MKSKQHVNNVPKAHGIYANIRGIRQIWHMIVKMKPTSHVRMGVTKMSAVDHVKATMSRLVETTNSVAAQAIIHQAMMRIIIYISVIRNDSTSSKPFVQVNRFREMRASYAAYVTVKFRQPVEKKISAVHRKII